MGLPGMVLLQINLIAECECYYACFSSYFDVALELCWPEEIELLIY